MKARHRLLLISGTLLLPGVLLAQMTLLEATQKGDVESVRRLLRAEGVDVEAKNTDGDTALLVAARGGTAAVVELLLAADASPEAANTAGDTPLLVAAKAGHLRIVEMLLGKEAPLDTVDKAGDTALILAVHHRRTEVAKLLIRKIDDVDLLNRKNKAGESAMYWAIKNGDVDLEKAIRDKGGTEHTGGHSGR
jgi:ankyrin repeat protein